ncbi:MAG: hypothetical protein Q9218_005119 [Villophora microphyllina]
MFVLITLVALLEDKLYFMGGEYTFYQGDTTSQAPNNATVQAFNVTSQTWSNASVSGGAYNSVTRQGAVAATSSTSGLGLGFITGGSTEDTPSGLVTFDASNPSALTWKNDTQGTPHLVLGSMQYARYGNKGVLIAFGGYLNLFNATLYDMSLTYVYDVESGEWFNITTTGDVPSDRSEMCSVISASPDDSSSQITSYGGYDIHNGSAYDDVYVLTIPAFQWIKINPKANPVSRLTPDTGRYAMSYQISRVIGGGPSGGATVVSPKGGFSDKTLAAIFQKTIPRFTKTVANSSPTASSTTKQSPSANASTSSTPVGVIVGGVVGGLAAVAIIGALFYFCVTKRRNRKNQAQQRSDETPQQWGKPELSTHATIRQKNNLTVHEMHEDALPREIDGSALVEAPPEDLEAKSAIFELSASKQTTHV